VTRAIRRPNAIHREVIAGRPKAIAEDVYGFKLFTREAAKQALGYFVAHSTPESPNSMNKYGRGLDREAREYVSELVEEYVAPIALGFYGIRLRKNPYAFLVDYSVETQKGLRWHVDSSDVTLNVCLGTVFKGGDLALAGVGVDGERLHVTQEIGRAIVHRGSLEHSATPLVAGHRTNLILWCSEYGSKPAGVPRR
jgi:hypothetical protein